MNIRRHIISFRSALRRAVCLHRWEQEGSLPVSRAYKTKGGVHFMPDHWRDYCRKCKATRNRQYIPGQ